MTINKIDARKFIEAWQTSDNTKQVADRLGLEWCQNAASKLGSRACFYRSKGVALKSFGRGRRPSIKLDWDDLSDVAEMYNDQ